MNLPCRRPGTDFRPDLGRRNDREISRISSVELDVSDRRIVEVCPRDRHHTAGRAGGGGERRNGRSHGGSRGLKAEHKQGHPDADYGHATARVSLYEGHGFILTFPHPHRPDSEILPRTRLCMHCSFLFGSCSPSTSSPKMRGSHRLYTPTFRQSNSYDHHPGPPHAPHEQRKAAAVAVLLT